jgi:hypothetical protein
VSPAPVLDWLGSHVLAGRAARYDKEEPAAG